MPILVTRNADYVQHGDGQDSGQEHGEHDEQYLRQGLHSHHHGKIIIIIFRRHCHHHHHQEVAVIITIFRIQFQCHHLII